MKFDQETLNVRSDDGLALVVDRWGRPSDPPVLLLHGGGQNRHAWKQTALNLVNAGFQTLAADARGHGDSGWSKQGAYDMENFASDVEQLVDIIGEAPAVVGASMGGMSALWAQGRSDSQLFSAVVLVDVTPRMELDGVERIMGFMAAHPEGFETLEDAADVIAAYNPHRERTGNVDGLKKVLRQRDGRWRWRWDPLWITSKAELMGAEPGAAAKRMDHMADELHRAARTITVPTLLVRGADSDLVSAASVREFLDVVPHADFIDVGGAGHMVAGDDNDAFTNAALHFLTRHTDPVEKNAPAT